LQITRERRKVDHLIDDPPGTKKKCGEARGVDGFEAGLKRRRTVLMERCIRVRDAVQAKLSIKGKMGGGEGWDGVVEMTWRKTGVNHLKEGPKTRTSPSHVRGWSKRVCVPRWRGGGIGKVEGRIRVLGDASTGFLRRPTARFHRASVKTGRRTRSEEKGRGRLRVEKGVSVRSGEGHLRVRKKENSPRPRQTSVRKRHGDDVGEGERNPRWVGWKAEEKVDRGIGKEPDLKLLAFLEGSGSLGRGQGGGKKGRRGVSTHDMIIQGGECTIDIGVKSEKV